MGSNPVADRLRGTDPDPRIEKFVETHGLDEDTAFALYDLVIDFVEESGPAPTGHWRHELERLRRENATLRQEKAERHQAAFEAVQKQDEEAKCPWGCGALMHNYVCEKMKETPYPEVPRRAFLDRLTPAEKAIYDCIQTVEGLGADVRLTQTVVKLGQAKDHLADFLDGVTPAYEAPEVRPTVPRAVYEETCEQLRAATDEGSLTRKLGELQASARGLINALPHPWTALEACRELAGHLGMTEEDLHRDRPNKVSDTKIGVIEKPMTDAIAVLTRDRDAWKERALNAEKRALVREVALFEAAREVSSDVYGSSMQDWPQFVKLREAVNAYLPAGLSAALPAIRQYALGEMGTLDGEAHREDVSEDTLTEAERYTLECISESKMGLPFNGRYLLSMVREIRRWRRLAATTMPEDFVEDILRREGLESTPAVLAGIHAAYRYGLAGYDDNTATRGRTEATRKERVLSGDSIDDTAAKLAYDFVERNSVRMQIGDQAQVADLLATTMRYYIDFVLRDPNRMPNARHRREVAEDIRKYVKNLTFDLQKKTGLTPSLLLSAADYIYPRERP